MKSIHIVIAALEMICFLGAAHAQGQDVEDAEQETAGLMVIRLQLRAGLQPDDGIFRGLDVVRYHRDSGELEMVITRSEYEALLDQGYEIEVTVWDSKKELLPRLQWRPSKGRREVDPASAPADSVYFHSYGEVVDMVHAMQTANPGLVKVDSIGQSHEGRAIWLVKIAENVAVDDPAKAGVYYDALHHAREHVGPELVLYFMNYLLSEYAAGNTRVVNILANRQLWFVPIVNPDGHHHSFTVEPLWRKNRRDNGDGTYGVDLNRNYTFNWGLDDIGSSPLTNAFDYRGPGPASEPEVQAIINFFEGPGSENRKLAITLNYHSPGNEWLLPWGYTLSQAPDFHIIKALGDSAAAYNGYAVGSWFPLLGYSGNGTSLDYLYYDGTTKSRIFSQLPEVGPEFIPPVALIPHLVGKNLGPNLFMAEYADLIGRLGPITTTSANQYVAPGADSIVVTASFTDPGNLAVSAYMNSVDSTQLNSMILFDDGSHNDGAAGDSLFGNAWTVPDGEYHYNLGVEVSVAEADTFTFGMTQFPRFTTVGPVVYDSHERTFGSAYPGSDYYFATTLRNGSSAVTVPDVTISLSSSDNCVEFVLSPIWNYGALAPGESKAGGSGASAARLRITSDCPEAYPIVIYIDIFSEGTVWWHDSLSITTLDIADAGSGLPTEFALHPAHPNPFNPTATLRYDLPQASAVRLAVFDLLGREVARLVDQRVEPGYHQLVWNGRTTGGQEAPSGIYIARLVTTGYANSIKMLLLK